MSIGALASRSSSNSSMFMPAQCPDLFRVNLPAQARKRKQVWKRWLTKLWIVRALSHSGAAAAFPAGRLGGRRRSLPFQRVHARLQRLILLARGDGHCLNRVELLAGYQIEPAAALARTLVPCASRL